MLEGTPEPQRVMYESEGDAVCGACLARMRESDPGREARPLSLDLPGDSRTCRVCNYERVVKWPDLRAHGFLLGELMEAQRRQVLELMVLTRSVLDDHLADDRPPGEYIRGRADYLPDGLPGAVAERATGPGPDDVKGR